MIKQITNSEGTFLLWNKGDDIYSYDISDTIDSSDKINIEQLKNFPKSLLTKNNIKPQIDNKHYTIKVLNDIPPFYDYHYYNPDTEEVKSFTYDKKNFLLRLKISNEPNIKIISSNQFYNYFNLYNDKITEEELMDLLQGFQGNQEDIDLTMKQLCYYDVSKYKSRILIEYIKNIQYKNIFSIENIYTKYIRDYINADTYFCDRNCYDLRGLYEIFDRTKETDIDFMHKHYIPLITEDIYRTEFYVKYIKTLNLKLHIAPHSIISDDKYLKNFLIQVNDRFNNIYNNYLKQSNLFISFIP